MKKLIYILAVFSLVYAHAQLDRSKLPEPGPAPEIEIGTPYTFELKNGMKVFLVENHKLPQVTFSLIIDRMPIMEGDKAGYVSIAGQMLRRGTTNRTKEELDEEIDFLGASISTGSTSISANGLSKYSEKLVELMADILYNPSFPEEELEKIRKQTISALQANKESPEAISSVVESAVLYGKNHPYGESETEETVNRITIEDVKEYYENYFIPNQSYLAVVGDITPEETEELVNKYFSDWKKGKYKEHSYEFPEKPTKTTIALVDRPQSVQSNISISNILTLTPGDPDVIKTRVMNYILGGGGSSRLFMNLREDKGYTYGAYSSLGSDRLVASFSAGASVRNEVTDSAVAEFIHELNKIREEPVLEEELQDAKNYIIGSFGRSLESPSTIASFALNTARYNLPDDYYTNYLKNIEAVTTEDVMEVANKYIQPENAYITIVGKKDEVLEGLKSFGELQEYDIYGNPEKEFDAGSVEVTPEQIIAKYVEKIGGKEKLESVSTLVTRAEISVEGQKITTSTIQKSPDKFTSITLMGMQEVSKTVYNNGQGMIKAMGNATPMNEKQLDMFKYQAVPFLEASYIEKGFEMELDGIKKVSGEEAYRIKITMPSGDKVTEFYSVESGLKLKTEGPQTVSYDEYKEYDGILMPSVLKVTTPMGVLDATVVEVSVNSDLPDSLFEVE